MPTVTAIQAQKRRPRADVYLDGEDALSLRLDVIATSKLEVGQALSWQQRRELEQADQRLTAVETALRLLALSPRSERDLRDRLRRHGLRHEAIDAAIGRMRELGYLNDAAYARLYVESRQASTPRSRRALAFELKRKGIEQELVSEAVEPLSDPDAAYEAAQRRLRALRSLDRPTFSRRLGSFLASRGFSYGVARTTIDRCWQETREEGETPDWP